MEPHPYTNLTPDRVLNAVESTGHCPDGHLIALNSYENRVYQVGIEAEAPLIAKFYRPERWNNAAILEEHHFINELNDAELPVIAPLTLYTGEIPSTLAEYAGFRFALFPRCGGRAPELDSKTTRAWIGRLLGRIHAIGQTQTYKHRPTLNCQHFGSEAQNWLHEQGTLPPECHHAWETTIAEALNGVAECYARAGECRLIRLHGDCHIGNILWNDQGPHLVDFDDSRNGPAIQDLWMLLEGERNDMQIQLNEILEAYRHFCTFNRNEIFLIEALRTLRLIHHSTWIARRWSDPAFPAAFPWFGTVTYWQSRIAELREQIQAMNSPPLCID